MNIPRVRAYACRSHTRRAAAAATAAAAYADNGWRVFVLTVARHCRPLLPLWADFNELRSQRRRRQRRRRAASAPRTDASFHNAFGRRRCCDGFEAHGCSCSCTQLYWHTFFGPTTRRQTASASAGVCNWTLYECVRR